MYEYITAATRLNLGHSRSQSSHLAAVVSVRPFLVTYRAILQQQPGGYEPFTFYWPCLM